MLFKGAICYVASCAYETDSAWFRVNLDGPEPLTYKWKRMYRWTNEWESLTNETNCFFKWTNADQWEDNSHVCVVVSNAAGETLELGPAKLSVYLMAISLPDSKTNSIGPASRYPATINVSGELTMGLKELVVTLNNLWHGRPEDLGFLQICYISTNYQLS